jgi:hypothetical protein
LLGEAGRHLNSLYRLAFGDPHIQMTLDRRKAPADPLLNGNQGRVLVFGQ